MAAFAVIGIIALTGCEPEIADNALFTEANRYPGDMPVGAKQVSPEEFAKGVANGSLVLVNAGTGEKERRDRAAELEADKAFAEAIPEDRRSPRLQQLLGEVGRAKDPFAEPTMPLRQADGSIRNVVLLSPAEGLHQAVYAQKISRTTENALSAYRIAFGAAPAAATVSLPTPDSLSGGSVERIDAARAQLDRALGGQGDLDRVAPEATPTTAPAPAPTPDGGDSEATAGGPPVSTTATVGADGPSPDCTHDAGGVFANFNWPLKHFLSPTKDQGSRGACWAFAAVGALESATQVTTGVSTNLSEQYFFYLPKFANSLVTWDSGSAERTLNWEAGSPQMTYADENLWHYNPSINRDDKDVPAYVNACRGYAGTCSASVHQAPQFCTTKKIFGGVELPFCAFQSVSMTGSVKPMGATTVWSSGDPLPTATLRAYLADGHVLMSSHGVYAGFDAAGGDTKGVVTDLSTAASRGSHQTIIVGFISNSALASRLPDIPAADGTGYFILKNSWGCAADGGYYLIPENYVKTAFTSLSLLNMPTTRSARWQQEQGSPQAPTLTITSPVTIKSGSIDVGTHYVDFTKPLLLAAQVDDGQDGTDCCKSTISWSSSAQGKVLGTLPKLPVTLTGNSDTITATARDRDNNVVSASMTLTDDYPVVTFSKPLNRSGAVQNTPVSFAVSVRTFGSNTALDCNGVTWTMPGSATGGGTGCTASISFFALGTNKVTANYSAGTRTANATVEVVVGKATTTNAAPYVTLNVRKRDDASLEQNAIIDLSIFQPGGAGDADLSKYKFAWEIEYQGVRKPFVPAAFLGRKNAILVIPSKVLTLPSCAAGPQTIKVYLTATDAAGKSGTASASYRFTVLGCVK